MSTVTMPGGYDVRFTFPALADGDSIGVVSNFVVDDSSEPETMVRLWRSGVDLLIEICPMDGTTIGTAVEIYPVTGVGAQAHTARVVGHNEFISIYLDDCWVYTFCFGSVTWSSDKTLYLYSSRAINLTGVCSGELFAWREIVYIEMEATGSSAIQSAIQERPVEVVPGHDGGLQFGYAFRRDRVTLQGARIKDHEEIEQDQIVAGSEAILYFSGGVAAVRNADYEDADGFATRVYRLSNLDMDAVAAGRILLERSYDSQGEPTFKTRLDPRIEIGDEVGVQYAISGTGTDSGLIVQVVENIRLLVSEAKIEMEISGRAA